MRFTFGPDLTRLRPINDAICWASLYFFRASILFCLLRRRGEVKCRGDGRRRRESSPESPSCALQEPVPAVLSIARSEATPSEAARAHYHGGSCRSGPSALPGGLVLSAVNDLAIFNGCTTKAIEYAADNPAVVEAIGAPLVRGPWYEASLEVGHRRRSVACTFPVSGPHGSGFLQIKATRNGEDGLLSFLRHHNWEILMLEAHLHVPSDDEEQKKLVKVNLASDGRGEDGDPESKC